MKSANKAVAEIMTLLKKAPKSSRKPRSNPYSHAIKEAVCKAVSQGTSPMDIAKLTGISDSAIYKWLKNPANFGDNIGVKAGTEIQRIEVLPALDSCQVQLPTGIKISFSGPLVSKAFEAAVLRGLS